ncbi:DUF6950 family protein [Rhodovulum kholense]|uniref:DUF6950 domain-containing protein n=1 Tax=Rhodovulum kholense TaxID=453584 RepID=A0A8E2VG31_9RHOB|nr:hypothetical protein [Rhodovulum kholense]PTW39245.1 hypothetical protein C8N38_1279 [Rhodovulum kholense]
MGEIMRREGWELRLAAEIRAWEGRAFAWGSADCLGFCRATARAMTGTDPIPDLPDYESEMQAAKGLVGLGFASLEDLVDAHLPRVAVARARRGDWVMTAAEGVMPGAMGVVTGRHAVHLAERGPVRRPVLDAEVAWRIG